MKKAITIFLLSAMLSGALTGCNVGEKTPSDTEPTSEMTQNTESTSSPSQEQEETPKAILCDLEKDVPAEYRALVKRFHETLTIRENRELTQEEMEALDQEGFVHLYEHAVNMGQQACFTFHDLNKDGSPELILLTSDAMIFAIYTLQDQRPSIVNRYRHSHQAAIGNDGSIYTAGYGKGNSWHFGIERILENGAIEEFAFGSVDTTEYYPDPELGEKYDFKIVNGVSTIIERSELDTLMESYKDQYAYVYVVPRDTLTKFNTKIYSAATLELIKDASEDPNQALFDTLQIPEHYRAVLSNRAKLCDQDGYFSYLNQSGELAVLDVDGDGEVEVLVRNGYGTTLLRLYNDIVYGYNFSVQGMYRLNSDGTYYWSANANIPSYGCDQLRFDGKKRAFEELDRVENDGTEQVKYYLAGSEVSKEVYEEYVSRQDSKTEVIWHQLAEYPATETGMK